MAPRSLLSLLLFTAACQGAMPTPPAEPPREPLAPAPSEGVLAPAPPGPSEPPAEPPPPDPFADQCQSDSDCAENQVCRERLTSACPECDGGRMVRVCVTLAEGCPRHVDCMPPIQGQCPPPGLRERCPDTLITH